MLVFVGTTYFALQGGGFAGLNIVIVTGCAGVLLRSGVLATYQDWRPARTDARRVPRGQQRPGRYLGMVGCRSVVVDFTNEAYNLGINYVIYTMTH